MDMYIADKLIKEFRAVKCPDCNSDMVLKYSRYGKFWGCSTWPSCGATHGAHPNGKPLGIPANSATKKLRIEAHGKFDERWKRRSMTRKQAYRELQEIMNLPKKSAHIGRFDAAQCLTLITFLVWEKDDEK